MREKKLKMRDYGVKAISTTVIDANIKVVEISDFPWIGGDGLYKQLKNKHLLKGD